MKNLLKHPRSKEILNQYNASSEMRKRVAAHMDSDEFKDQKATRRRESFKTVILAIPRFVKQHFNEIVALATLVAAILALLPEFR